MNSQENRMGLTSAASAQPRDNNFDFGLWSRLVRQQMMSSLQKRQRER
ncbi:MAG: hypothetical protein WBA57_09635 [Elainellaceae cyanobacterium]